jgi:hypothetical protein
MEQYSQSYTLNTRGGDRRHHFRTGLPSVALIALGRASDEEVGDVWAYPADEKWGRGLHSGTG